MKTGNDGNQKRWRGMAVVLALALFAGLGLGAGCESSGSGSGGIDAKATEILKGMSDRLATAQSMTIRADRSIDPALVEGRNTIDRASLTVSMARPNLVVASAVNTDQERFMYYDGKTFSLHDVREKAYGQMDFAGDLDGLLDMIEGKLGFSLPVGEFLRKDPYASLTSHATSGEYVGQETDGAKEVHHLSFTEEGLAWDLWVGVEDQLPHKMVARSTVLEGEPGVEVNFGRIDLGPTLEQEMFAFKLVAGLELLEMMSSESLESE